MAITGATAPARGWHDEDKDRIPAEVKRDQWGRPLVEQPDGTSKGYTRASTLGDAIEARFAIETRNKRYLVKGMGQRSLSLDAAAVVGVEEPADRKRLDNIAQRALTASGADELADVGTALHAILERVDRGDMPADLGDDARAVEAYVELMAGRFEVMSSEVYVVNHELRAAGTYDKRLRLLVPLQPNDAKGNPIGPPLPVGTIICGDVKTAQTDKYFGVKFACQFAVYQGGRVVNLETGGETEHGMHDRWALIIYVPSGAGLAELQWVDLEQGRNLARLAVEILDARKAKNLVARVANLPAPAVTPIEDAACPQHGPHPMTVDCVDCLYPADLPAIADVLCDEHVSLSCPCPRPTAGTTAAALDALEVEDISAPAPVIPAPRTASGPAPYAQEVAVGLRQAHVRHVLRDQIRQIKGSTRAEIDAAARDLWVTNHRIWTDEHTTEVTARMTGVTS